MRGFNEDGGVLAHALSEASEKPQLSLDFVQYGMDFEVRWLEILSSVTRTEEQAQD